MLTGKNILLRPATVEDAQLLADWFSDPDYFGLYNNVWPMVRQDWEQSLSTRHDGHENAIYLIISCENGEPLGATGYFVPFTNNDFFKGYEIWYQVHPQHRGRGIATQAACLLINHLFDALPVERIQATIAVGNDGSCRVVERAGMQRDGIYRKVTFLHGRYADMYLYSIVRDDWQDETTYRRNRPPF